MYTEIVEYLDNWVDFSGEVIFIFLALIVMASINVFCDLRRLCTVGNCSVNRASYWAIVSKSTVEPAGTATGHVTEFIADICNGVQAIKGGRRRKQSYQPF